MVDNNKTPCWVRDAEHFAKTMKEWEKKPFKEKYIGFIVKPEANTPFRHNKLPIDLINKFKASIMGKVVKRYEPCKKGKVVMCRCKKDQDCNENQLKK